MQLTDNDFYRLRDFMYDNFGVNLAQKRTLIEGRLQSVLKEKGVKSFSEFIDSLLSDQSGGEVSLLVSKLTTNFTYFMREEQHFDFLQKNILPDVVPKLKDNNVAIWSAGCSSGEEPYSIAMVLDDYFKTSKGGLDTRVLASDISERVLNAAKMGIYGEDRMSKLPGDWKKRYFVGLGDERYQVVPQIKREIIFRKFNLMEPVFRFKRKFHVIFCRNVMIYFDAQTRAALAEKFYQNLLPGGYLFIGMSESLINSNTNLEYVKPSIYRKPL
jgi:chemotaxis protein methyltransferase CheR